ncbi:uncharacterized protein LOC129649507 isoform X1 [Bubalus kerabau]|uniref:uncharacterized protein LOC129649507 isoform X1 n=1 Tax=Bubalus carabanensis TaxID=3119969 RepID=UPI00244E9BA1|nr:uncharacterized protein LOC129649507 isoform X1 [Bubalus carabanensis]
MSYFMASSELGGHGPHPPWKPMACSVKSLHSCYLTDPFCHPPRRQSTTFPLCSPASPFSPLQRQAGNRGARECSHRLTDGEAESSGRFQRTETESGRDMGAVRRPWPPPRPLLGPRPRDRVDSQHGRFPHFIILYLLPWIVLSAGPHGRVSLQPPGDRIAGLKDICISSLTRDFAGGPVTENLPAKARDTGLIPGQGRLHMPRATEPVSHNYRETRAVEPALHNKRSHHNEKPVYPNRVAPSRSN